MAYFKLDAPSQIVRYRLDYHSHFSGILPVHSRDENDRLSLAGVIRGASRHPDNEQAPARAELLLFDYALRFMMDPGTNPFARLLKSPNRAQYERAECAAENIYMASVLIGRRFGYLPLETLSQSAALPYVYGAVQREVIGRALRSKKPDPSLLKMVEYFNGKIYSSNKYTPFDDSYKMRGHFVKALCDGDPAKIKSWREDQKKKYHAWIRSTFDYLKTHEGITHTQTAVGDDEMEELALQTRIYNSAKGTGYKLLVHTAHQYLPDGVLRKHLDEKVAPLLKASDSGLDIVGIDLLGAENKVGNYRELFEFLHKFLGDGAAKANFGPEGLRSLTLVAHVHCGEGSGFGTDNRSMIGYFMHEAGDPDAQFYADLANYVLACHEAAEARRRDTPRGAAGRTHRWSVVREGAIPSGLFDELFQNNSLTYRGRLLRRFAISSEKSRELAAYNAKRSIMAFSDTLERKVDGQAADPTWYEWLAAPGTPVAVRLGHAYYYRNYIAARYPLVAYDTNLGSNAITGASGLFNSIEGYRINRGFRQLEGSVDTNVLQAVTNAVAYMASEALTDEQIAFLTKASAADKNLKEILESSAGWIHTQLQNALGGIYDDLNKDYFFESYCTLVRQTVGDASTGALRYQAMSRVLTLFQNWRSYLLGADGQGIEHTSIQHEFLRMLILLAYSLLPTGQTRVDSDLLLKLQYTLIRIAENYWRHTVGPAEFLPELSAYNLEIVGFKSPDSVVTLRRIPGRQ